jgi:hypothetical protein
MVVLLLLILLLLAVHLWLYIRLLYISLATVALVHHLATISSIVYNDCWSSHTHTSDWHSTHAHATNRNATHTHAHTSHAHAIALNHLRAPKKTISFNDCCTTAKAIIGLNVLRATKEALVLYYSRATTETIV